MQAPLTENLQCHIVSVVWIHYTDWKEKIPGSICLTSRIPSLRRTSHTMCIAACGCNTSVAQRATLFDQHMTMTKLLPFLHMVDVLG